MPAVARCCAIGDPDARFVMKKWTPSSSSTTKEALCLWFCRILHVEICFFYLSWLWIGLYRVPCYLIMPPAQRELCKAMQHRFHSFPIPTRVPPLLLSCLSSANSRDILPCSWQTCMQSTDAHSSTIARAMVNWTAPLIFEWLYVAKTQASLTVADDCRSL